MAGAGSRLRLGLDSWTIASVSGIPADELAVVAELQGLAIEALESRDADLKARNADLGLQNGELSAQVAALEERLAAGVAELGQLVDAVVIR